MHFKKSVESSRLVCNVTTPAHTFSSPALIPLIDSEFMKTPAVNSNIARYWEMQRKLTREASWPSWEKKTGGRNLPQQGKMVGLSEKIIGK